MKTVYITIYATILKSIFFDFGVTNNPRFLLIKILMKKPHILSSFQKFSIIQPYLEDGVSLSKIAKYHDIGLSTLKKWVKYYRKDGVAGLKRKQRSDKGIRQNISIELEALAEALILKKPPISLAAVHRKIVEVAKDKGEQIPSYRIIRHIAQKIDPALLLLAHEGSKAYNQQYELIYRREASAPNKIWQADHTPLDIVLLDETGESRKPWLTIIIDDYSRVISGYFISFDPPCSIHVALALRQAIWRKSNPRWQICGIPEILYSDNGSDFKSKHIKQVAIDLKIQLKNSIPGKPQGRGRVERFFLTVTQLLLMNLPGYTPPKTTFPTATMTLEEFTPLFEKFIIENYHQRIHSTIGMPPLVRWNENSFLPRLAESLEQLDLLLLTVVKPRKVRRDGIHFKTFRYMDITLAAFVGESVTIRFDPRDLAEIRVYHNDQFLCKAVCQELASYTISLKEITRARQKRKRELRKVINEKKSLLDIVLASKNEKNIAINNKKESEEKTAKPSKKIKLKLYEND